MEFFRNFSSNTLAGSGNQSFFLPEDADTVYTGRIFYRIFAGGSNRYSFLFSNIVDSTFSDGSHSHMNLLCDQWRVVRAAAGVCRSCTAETMARVEYFQPLTFSGAAGKEVMPGEFFSSDPVTLDLDRGDYICLELSVQGSMIPCHEESILPAFVLTGDSWKPSKHLPFAGMVGCDRNTALRIGFLGDSITQGIGTEPNSYDHWNAKLAEMLGEKYACWNLGLGFGRAEDAASDGAWLFKAKQTDVAVVCFGVNDLFQTGDTEKLQRNLDRIVTLLQAAGVKVVVQTIPPFDYSGDLIDKWRQVNRYILERLSQKADLVFDVVPVLQRSESKPYLARYGGHPDREGCQAWADALFSVLKPFLDTLVPRL